ncbi:hypothetical protein [Pedobacter rhodius]|uniref:Nucleotidyl transferase AbiEii toxin, Type IV TA system n=1 Tax=Pedobacter rhodius TaxID=3004098 RepID=A0ABT4KX97_9SPHI|nr:hypothetical protein [Pedobacter sp. SJ11]MCZ4223554.1 hypothetical protein [Pedobacter sp. SJ11]
MLSFFNKIVDVLNGNNIPYMLSGSIAMGVYIVPRATRDFDFIIHLQPKDVDAFVSNFQDGYYCNVNSVKDAIKQQSLFNIIDHASGYKADFVILKNEEFRQEEFNRRVEMEYFGKSVYLVTVEDLLISKLIWIQVLQSAIQVNDIKNLAELETLDWDYINKWVKILKLATFNLFK